jgi:hypothetical protein
MNDKQTIKTSKEQETTVPLTMQDHAILDSVDRYLTAGLQLKQWWEQTDTSNAYAERFEEALTFNRPDTSFGFFDHAPVGGQTIPVMGDVQDILYDQAKAPSEQTGETAQWVRDQIREFILHYFMRVSDFQQPQGTEEDGRSAMPAYLRPLSLCPPGDAQRVGFGFSQLFYKLRESGRIGQFPSEERFAIVDLREIGEKYEWIVVKVRIFDFNLTYPPLGADAPQLVLPLSEDSYLVLSHDCITNEDNPKPGVLGKYGLGYAFIKDPTRNLVAYGPGQFDAAIELINFRVLEDGKIRVHMVFVANQPERILNLSLDPVGWGVTLMDLMSFGLTSRVLAPMQGVLDQLPWGGVDVDPVDTFIRLANLLTGGQAAKQLCLSREGLNKQFLIKHFTQHYQAIVGSLQTWRQIPDWLAGEENLPRWVVRGVTS